jgi:DNA-binding GntR family transcriptional regulator
MDAEAEERAADVGVPAFSSDGDTASAERAYVSLRRLILDGELEPDEPLSQVRLSQLLGVSRTPLREAVRLLQMEGLVTSEFNRRVRVAPIGAERYEDLYAMRIALEPLAVRLTVDRLTPAELDAIEGSLAAVDEAALRHDFPAVREPHRTFHLGLVQHAGADLIARVADMWDHAERFRVLYDRRVAHIDSSHDISRGEHHAILAAAREGHAIRAATLVADHLGRVVLTTLAGVHPLHDPRAVRAALSLVHGWGRGA